MTVSDLQCGRDGILNFNGIGSIISGGELGYRQDGQNAEHFTGERYYRSSKSNHRHLKA